MKRLCQSCVFAALVTVTWILSANALFADSPSNSDLWNVRPGFSVSSDAVYPGSDIRNMFGGDFGYIEPGEGVTLFADGRNIGHSHSVYWTTPEDVTIGSFKLYAAHDPSNYYYDRSFNYFTLSAKPAGESNYSVLFETSINVPYVYEDDSCRLLISHTLAIPVTARDFKATFRQASYSGPRIIELDGFAPVPEPGALSALVCGMVSLFGLVRKRK